MVRSIEPQLIEVTPMEISERASLALFLGELQAHPQIMAGILGAYPRASDIIAEAQQLEPEDNAHQSQILRATSRVLEAKIDQKLRTDSLTLEITQEKIEAASASEHVSPDHRRAIRIATFAGEVAAWCNYQEIVNEREEGWAPQINLDAAPAMRVVDANTPPALYVVPPQPDSLADTATL